MPSSRSRRERGAAAVEMAIVLPLLLLVLAGIIDLSRAFFTNMSLATSAREGARAAVLITAPTPTGPCPVVNTCIRQRALVAAPTGAEIPESLIQNCVGATATSPPASVTARVPNFDYIVLGGIMGLFGSTPSTPHLSETAQMRCNV